MSLVINTNSTATQSRNYLAANQTNLQRSLGRLASGSRIVRPSDDAGGLAVGNKITATVNRNVRTQQNAKQRHLVPSGSRWCAFFSGQDSRSYERAQDHVLGCDQERA